MTIINKKLFALLLLMAVLRFCCPAAFAASSECSELGNTSLNILNGGVMLTGEDCFYYSEGGIYRETTGAILKLSDEDGANLNISGGWLWYTLDDGKVRRMPEDGGDAETVYEFGTHIKQMYVVSGESLHFISGGHSYVYDINFGECRTNSELTDIAGLIPTEFGDVYLCGEVFDYRLYAGENLLLTGVTGAYSDSGFLAVELDGVNYQIELSRLFSDFDKSSDLQPFDIHGSEPIVQLFSDDDGVCEVCEAAAQAYLLAGDADAADKSNAKRDASDGAFVPELTQGQINIVKRARQLHEIVWTPLADRNSWGSYGVFSAGVTLRGLPYGQPIGSSGYVGYNVSLEEFAAAVSDSTSVFYRAYSTFNKKAPYYSCDCSSFVSYAWGFAERTTTAVWPYYAAKVSDQSIYSLQVGDALNYAGRHIVMVSDIGYDRDGNITSITIIEQTPPKTRLTTYGENGEYPLSRIQSYYLSGGYRIYRNPKRDEVTYTHSCAVPIDGDYCPSCKSEVPIVRWAWANGSKALELSHSHPGAVIYYTLDGSEPTTSSAVYSSPIAVNSAVTLKAMAVTNLSKGNVLTYKVNMSYSDAPTVSVKNPTASIKSGLVGGGYVHPGTEIALSCGTYGAALYYTLNGSEPTTASARYTGPITINSDTTIKFFAYMYGYRSSDTVTVSYKVGDVSMIGINGSISSSTQSVGVDGEQVVFQTYAIKDEKGFSTNYIKLRDIAMHLIDTNVKFDVDWDAATGTISVTSGQSYQPVGSEMTSIPFYGKRSYEAGSSKLTIDGQTVDVESVLITDDYGSGYTFFKLRDLGKLLDFNVSWSPEAGIYINTDQSYSAEN